MTVLPGSPPTPPPCHAPTEYADWPDPIKVLHLERRLAQLTRQLEHQEILADNQRHLLKARQRDLQATLSRLREKHDELAILHQDLAAAKDHLEEEVRKRTRELEEKNVQLEQHALELEQINTTLDVLIRKNNQDCEALSQSLLDQQQSVIAPLLTRLQLLNRDPVQQALIQQISTFLHTNGTAQARLPEPQAPLCSILTQRELEVARHLSQGKACRTLALALGLSVRTVESCCANIRKKVKLRRGVNLRAYLAGMGGLGGQ